LLYRPASEERTMKTNARRWVFQAATAAVLCLGGCFCGAAPGQTEASLYVSDSATGQPVRAPSFTEGQAALSASCQQPDAKDPTLCTSQLLLLSPDVHTVTVAAAGYQSQQVTIDTSSMDSVHLAVEMTAAK
jgi:hypothetical protein